MLQQITFLLVDLLVKVLYISYDGVLEPLGKSQVLSYIEKLAVGRSIHLVSFEKRSELVLDTNLMSLKHKLSLSGVIWHPLTYHKRPSVGSTVWDIGLGLGYCFLLSIRHRIDLIHARSYVPAVIALVLTKLLGTSFLFDMRGFWADEKLDDGWSSGGVLYRIAKFFEKRFFLSATHVISLTKTAVPIIQNLPYLRSNPPPITVIPTCTDLSQFRPIGRTSRSQWLTIGYVGTASNSYLFDQTAACFAELLTIRSDARFLIVNRSEHDFIINRIQAACIPLSSVHIISAKYEEMPRIMSSMDASIYFIKPVFSKQASSATKLGELLACGVPCMTNWGIGDVEEIFQGERIGVVLQSFERTLMVEGINQLLSLIADPDTLSRCRSVAEKRFSLEEGVKRYDEIYKRLDSSAR